MPSGPPRDLQSEVMIRPVALSPPAFTNRRQVIFLAGLGILTGISLLLTGWLFAPQLFLAGQMALLTVGLCVTPTIARQLAKRRGRTLRAALETALFTALILVFGAWLLGADAFGLWIAYAVGLILILEIGSHFLEWYKLVTLKRLSRSTSFKSLRAEADAVEELFLSEMSFYVCLFFGIASGTVFVQREEFSIQERLVLILNFVLAAGIYALLIFVGRGFRQMSDPLFTRCDVQSLDLRRELRGGIVLPRTWVLRILVPPEKEKTDLDLACMAVDLRKLYLYDSVHNIILLVGLTGVGFGLLGIGVDIRWLVGSLVVALFVLAQLPYVIGQSRLHRKVLEPHEGLKRAEIASQLKNYAPLFPRSEFLTALFTTGTAGALVYYLLDQSVKNFFK